jgi:hypothetical protein
MVFVFPIEKDRPMEAKVEILTPWCYVSFFNGIVDPTYPDRVHLWSFILKDMGNVEWI